MSCFDELLRHFVRLALHTAATTLPEYRRFGVGLVVIDFTGLKQLICGLPVY